MKQNKQTNKHRQDVRVCHCKDVLSHFERGNCHRSHIPRRENSTHIPERDAQGYTTLLTPCNNLC